MRTTPTRWLAGAVAALLLLTGCTASGADDLAGITGGGAEDVAEDDAGAGGAPVECDDALQSYTPPSEQPGPGDMPAGSTMEEIAERGSLIVGVSADTLLMSARNPFSGQIEGFDIDVLRQVSEAIFGDPDRLQFRVITSAQRIEVLESGEVDLVARTFTINCERWESIAFSAQYFAAGQKVLVSTENQAQSLDDLSGARVCAPRETTTLDRLADYPEIEAVGAATHGQCLALFQQGQVDAITGDDTILAGFAAQDPYAVVVGDAISAEPYGIGVPAGNVDMVGFVNGVLEQMIEDGTWTTLYERWLGVLGEAPEPPEPQYGRAA